MVLVIERAFPIKHDLAAPIGRDARGSITRFGDDRANGLTLDRSEHQPHVRMVRRTGIRMINPSAVIDLSASGRDTSRMHEALRGRFKAFEGPDGSGKSTQMARFAGVARGQGIEVVEVREPGGTSVGEQIREVLLDPANTDMTIRCEMLLYMASRAQLVEQVIAPALARQALVIADRFVASTCAYQGTAGGLPMREILDVAGVATGHRLPELTVIFDVDEATAAKRLNPLLDRMEQKGAEFHRRVRQGYHRLVKEDPDHVLLIDATGDEDSVHQTAMAAIESRLLTVRSR